MNRTVQLTVTYDSPIGQSTVQGLIDMISETEDVTMVTGVQTTEPVVWINPAETATD